METLYVKHYDELSRDELYSILRARAQVFVVEQNCPYQDLDAKDSRAYHLWIEDDRDGILAYSRVLERGVSFDEVAIGRVISIRRGEHYGKRIMLAAIEVARKQYSAAVISLEAQVYAKGFYEKFGFVQSSEEFDEDGIPHIKMTLILDK